MRNLKMIAVVAMGLPAAALAQVGPNPAVSGGSLDPTIGASTDLLTAPQDAGSGLSTGTTMSGPDTAQTNGATTKADVTPPTTGRSTTAIPTGPTAGPKAMKSRTPKR